MCRDLDGKVIVPFLLPKSTKNYTTPDDDQEYSRKHLDRRYGTIPVPSRL